MSTDELTTTSKEPTNPPMPNDYLQKVAGAGGPKRGPIYQECHVTGHGKLYLCDALRLAARKLDRLLTEIKTRTGHTGIPGPTIQRELLDGLERLDF